MNLTFRPEARLEFDEAVDWYNTQAGLGAAFISAVNNTLDSLCSDPESYPKVHRDTRRISVPRYPYSIFFRELQDDILILAVFHHSRNPEEWQARSIRN